MVKQIQRLAIACLLMLSMCSVIYAQAEKALQFEVASIKVNKSGVAGGTGACHGADQTRSSVVPLGHCLFSNVSVRLLFNEAYAAEVVTGDRPAPGETLRMVGLPDWGRSERFDVDAKSDDATATTAQLREMLRALLTERFDLQFHRESKEVPGYRLIVWKDGPKLSPPGSDDRFQFLARSQEATAQNAPLSDLQNFLSVRLGAPVTNATGLAGNYNFKLTFSPINGDVADSGGPSVFTALQQQLGLKLETTRVPVVNFVVDRIRRPN